MGARYPEAGYGIRFAGWLTYGEQPYNSWGNGSAMRVSPCGWVDPKVRLAHPELGDPETLAAVSAGVTHNHPEGIKGAVETARAIRLMLQARETPDYPGNLGEWKEEIRRQSNYDLSAGLEEIRAAYRFDGSCQGTVPQAIIAFLESTDFEDAIRNAVSLGGDSDTLAAITGSIAEAAYGIPQWIVEKAWTFLDAPLRQTCRKWRRFLGD